MSNPLAPFDPGQVPGAFFYPSGVVVRHAVAPPPTRLTMGQARYRPLTFTAGGARPRTLSDGTIETANVRRTMFRSITDLYANAGARTVSFLLCPES